MSPETMATLYDVGVTMTGAFILMNAFSNRKFTYFLLCLTVWFVGSISLLIYLTAFSTVVIAGGATAVVLLTATLLIYRTLPADYEDDQR